MSSAYVVHMSFRVLRVPSQHHAVALKQYCGTQTWPHPHTDPGVQSHTFRTQIRHTIAHTPHTFADSGIQSHTFRTQIPAYNRTHSAHRFRLTIAHLLHTFRTPSAHIRTRSHTDPGVQAGPWDRAGCALAGGLQQAQCKCVCVRARALRARATVAQQHPFPPSINSHTHTRA